MLMLTETNIYLVTCHGPGAESCDRRYDVGIIMAPSLQERKQPWIKESQLHIVSDRGVGIRMHAHTGGWGGGRRGEEVQLQCMGS